MISLFHSNHFKQMWNLQQNSFNRTHKKKCGKYGPLTSYKKCAGRSKLERSGFKNVLFLSEQTKLSIFTEVDAPQEEIIF